MKQLTFVSLQVRDLQASMAFYINKLGFGIASTNPHACVFAYNAGEASFAIRTPLEQIDGRELGVGVAVWFAVDEDVTEMRARYLEMDLENVGPVIETPFGKAFHVADPDGYKLTFLNAI